MNGRAHGCGMLPAMPIEHAQDHPTFELGTTTITSLAAPARGSSEIALFRADLPAGSGLPPHRHDHFDVFTVTEGACEAHLGDEVAMLEPGDSAVVPPASSTGSRRGPVARRSSSRCSAAPG